MRNLYKKYTTYLFVVAFTTTCFLMRFLLFAELFAAKSQACKCQAGAHHNLDAREQIEQNTFISFKRTYTLYVSM